MTDIIKELEKAIEGLYHAMIRCKDRDSRKREHCDICDSHSKDISRMKGKIEGLKALHKTG